MMTDQEKDALHVISAAETTRLSSENPRPSMIRTRGVAHDLTADQKARIVEGMRAGQSLASVLRDNPDLPGATAIRKARNSDEQFDAAFVEARADGLAANIDEALDYGHAVRGNKALSVAASKYTDALLKAAPLMAPRTFGPMLKLAGADGEKLTLQLVSYLPQTQQTQQVLPAEFAKVEALPASDD